MNAYFFNFFKVMFSLVQPGLLDFDDSTKQHIPYKD